MPGSESAIHPTAIVSGELTLGEGARIGPYCVVEGPLTLGAGSVLRSHCVVQGPTLIGQRCTIGPHATVGADPQHRGYNGAETFLVVEDDVLIREYASLHRAMHPGPEHATRVGRGSMLMGGSHVGHDARVGEDVVLANNVLLAGHVTIGARAFIGGATTVHQFVRVGRLAMIAGSEGVSKDVMPFGSVFYRRHRAYNAVGCRRAGLSAEVIAELRRAFRLIHASVSAGQAAEQLRAQGLADQVHEIRELVEFIETSKRGLVPSARGSLRASTLD